MGTYTVMLLARITVEELLKIVRRLSIQVRYSFKAFMRSRAKPALLIRSQTSRAGRRFQELAPGINNLLDVLVDRWIEKSSESRRCAHRPVEKSIDGQTNNVVLLRLGYPVGGTGEDVVQNLEHMLV